MHATMTGLQYLEIQMHNFNSTLILQILQYQPKQQRYKSFIRETSFLTR